MNSVHCYDSVRGGEEGERKRRGREEREGRGGEGKEGNDNTNEGIQKKYMKIGLESYENTL